MRKIIYLGIFLGIIAAFSTIIMAATNQVTSPIINERLQALFGEGVITSFPTHTHFDVIDVYDVPYTHQILVVYEDDEFLGFVYSQAVIGFASTIQYLVGIDSEGYFTSFFVVFQGESPGFGEQLFGDEWISRIVYNRGSDRIDTLTGVTVSTAPIVRALEVAYRDHIERIENIH